MEFEANAYYTTKDEFVANLATMQETCIGVGGYLAELNTKQEYDFVLNFLKTEVETSERGHVLLGASDDNTGNEWRYLQSGAPLEWVSWKRHTSEKCMWIIWNDWNDEGLHQWRCYGGNPLRPLCEIPQTGKSLKLHCQY